MLLRKHALVPAPLPTPNFGVVLGKRKIGGPVFATIIFALVVFGTSYAIHLMGLTWFNFFPLVLIVIVAVAWVDYLRDSLTKVKKKFDFEVAENKKWYLKEIFIPWLEHKYRLVLTYEQGAQLFDGQSTNIVILKRGKPLNVEARLTGLEGIRSALEGSSFAHAQVVRLTVTGIRGEYKP